MTHDPARPRERNTFSQTCPLRKAELCFHSTCCRSSGVPLESEESRQVAGQHGSPPSSRKSPSKKTDACLHASKTRPSVSSRLLLLLPLRQSVIGHKLVCSFSSFLCRKVHTHLKNRNLYHLVLLHQTNVMIFFFFFYIYISEEEQTPNGSHT